MSLPAACVLMAMCNPVSVDYDMAVAAATPGYCIVIRDRQSRQKYRALDRQDAETFVIVWTMLANLGIKSEEMTFRCDDAR